MLREAGGAEDGVAQDTKPAESERVYRCAACRALVTRARWAIAVNGAHERAVFNPAGILFRILTFREAPGAAHAGAATADFTWFRGFTWRLCLCRVCGAHLGWRYQGAASPQVFFGLIKNRLVPGSAPD